MTLKAEVVHGRREGPRLFVCAAIHGDELNGIEVIRQLLKRRVLRRLRGTLIAVPIVNAYGVLNHSRYLPDRRDLNRTFPGHERGSLASRLADLFMSEVVKRCTHGVDLHTGAVHRTNLPQIRANLDDPETSELAEAFGVPVILNSKLRDGSLRDAANSVGVKMLLYEGGEALRLDEVAVRAGLQGTLHVMQHLGMLSAPRTARVTRPQVARSSSWIRSPGSGLFNAQIRLGASVERGDRIGSITQPFGGETGIEASYAGIVIGHTRLPLVHEGDALVHIARFEDHSEAVEQVEAFHDAQESSDSELDPSGD
jgi:predicted deacylase